jgi:GrpB-like predicted nucleotidyltransferase (UPF0157 family)
MAEIGRWMEGVPELLKVHHIGSTSVPGLPAKPVIDLLPVFTDAAARDRAKAAVAALGYDWLGEKGLAGRAYARRDCPETGRRLFHAHCHAGGHPGIRRHLAFRDALRDNAALRAGYTSVKAACAARHPDGGRDYQACKSEWIDQVEAKALQRLT